MSSAARPADVCRALLAALDAAEGRRRSRKRDQTPDAIGLAIKRELLEQAIHDNPEPSDFEAWLLNSTQIFAGSAAPGSVAAIARIVFDEWTLAHSMGDFKAWLDSGAPSDDAKAAPASPRENAAKR